MLKIFSYIITFLAGILVGKTRFQSQKKRVNNFDGGLYLSFEESEVEHDG